MKNTSNCFNVIHSHSHGRCIAFNCTERRKFHWKSGCEIDYEYFLTQERILLMSHWFLHISITRAFLGFCSHFPKFSKHCIGWSRFKEESYQEVSFEKHATYAVRSWKQHCIGLSLKVCTTDAIFVRLKYWITQNDMTFGWSSTNEFWIWPISWNQLTKCQTMEKIIR